MFPDFYQNERCLKWTPSAIDCYNRGCVCMGCPIYSIMETQCFMKKTVLELVRVLGKPPEQKTIDLNEIVRELEKGRTLKEIAAELGMSPVALQSLTKPTGISAHHFKDKRKKNK